MTTTKTVSLQRLRTRIGIAALVALGLIALAWGGRWLSYRLTHVTTDAAFVKAEMVQLALLTSGRVAEVLVDEGDRVEKGALLLALDAREAQLAVERAEAVFLLAEQNLQRRQGTPGAVAETAEAQHREAKAALEQARLNLAHTRLEAPFAGIVAKRLIEPGDVAIRGVPVLALYDPATLHVIANLEEGKLGRVRVGADVDLFLEAFRERLRGKVVRIGSATAAEFALVPRDTSAGEFTKVVQRVPIKIEIDDRARHPLLRPGLSVSIGISRD